jgi:hypothetical protein
LNQASLSLTAQLPLYHRDLASLFNPSLLTASAILAQVTTHACHAGRALAEKKKKEWPTYYKPGRHAFESHRPDQILFCSF